MYDYSILEMAGSMGIQNSIAQPNKVSALA